jgi:hypothetical protein
MKFPFNKFTNNLVFFLILSFIILSYVVFFRYKEGAWGRTISKQVKQTQSTNTNNRNSSSSSTLMTPTYSVQTYTSTPTIIPPSCNLMTYEECGQKSGSCMWDNITSGCLNKLDCMNLNQTNCSKQNYCAWNSSINKCSIKT